MTNQTIKSRRESAMNFQAGDVRKCDSFSFCGEQLPNPHVAASDIKLPAEFSVFEDLGHVAYSATAVFSNGSVAHVLRVRAKAEIRALVVLRVPVYVINALALPGPSNNAMHQIPRASRRVNVITNAHGAPATTAHQLSVGIVNFKNIAGGGCYVHVK